MDVDCKVSSGETWRIRKNVVVVTVAFMIHYTAIHGNGNLQSSINAEAGLGTSALAAVFMGVLLSNIFLTSLIIKWLGTKWTICCSIIINMPFIAFQLYPRFGTLVPAGFLMGLGGGTLLCAKSTYISVLAEAYGMIVNLPSSTYLISFSGSFFMVVHMSHIWGNLISSLVLTTTNNASMTLVNETMIPQTCGGNFLPDKDAAEALPTQPFEKILMLASIYLTCMVGAALLVAIGLDSMNRYHFCRKTSNSRSGFALLAVTVKQLADTNQQLLLVINVFIGLQQAFFFADFTASFVSCVIGTGSVGYVMMTYGISNVVGCFVTVCFPKLLGRLPLMCSALFIHGGILVTLLTWRPHAEEYHVILTIAVLWGICDSIWAIQITTYHAILFRGKEEAAFSNLGLWEGVGYIISYAISAHVRTRYKIFLLLCMLILGCTGYFSVEYRQRKKDKELQEKNWIKDSKTVAELAELEKLTF